MTDVFAWGAAAALPIGYLLGSIPFGLILTRVAGLGDIRSIGSGNIGATNVLRTGRKELAAATLLLDGLKGTLAVGIGWDFGLYGALAAALGAYLGHCFPVWLKFKGGKGVATFLGVLLGLHWPTMVLTALDLARRRRGEALLLARGACRKHGRSAPADLLRTLRDGSALRGADRDHLVQAQGQRETAYRRPGIAHRRSQELIPPPEARPAFPTRSAPPTIRACRIGAPPPWFGRLRKGSGWLSKQQASR